VFDRSAKPAAAPGDGLDSVTRRRLDRFAAGFDTLTAESLELYTGREPDASVSEAMRAADLALGNGATREATKRAIQSFVNAAQVRFAEVFSPMLLLGIGRHTARADDRFRIFTSLERAVVAIVVWDRLDETEQAALAGPWGPLVEDAVEGA
jgi:hypothetical protein